MNVLKPQEVQTIQKRLMILTAINFFIMSVYIFFIPAGFNILESILISVMSTIAGAFACGIVYGALFALVKDPEHEYKQRFMRWAAHIMYLYQLVMIFAAIVCIPVITIILLIF